MPAPTSGKATHGKLLEQMRSCGYEASQEGTCFGYAHMWVQAVLSGEEEKFHERVRMLCETSDLPSKIAAVREKIKAKDEKLSQEEKNLLEVMAFFDGIELYQQPENYPEIFQKHLHQKSIELISKFVTSKAIEKEQGLSIIQNDERILTSHETTEYFSQLRNILRGAYENKEPIDNIPITMSSYLTHRIGLRYDYHQDTWIMADANNMPTLKVPPAEIASEIMKKLGEPKMFAMQARFYSTTQQAKKLNHLIRELKKNKENQIYSKEITERISDRGNTLVEMAVWYEDETVIKKLQALNQPTIWNQIDKKSQQNLLHTVAYTKESSLIKYLLETKASQNLQDINGKTPLHYATETQNIQIIRSLIASKSDINLQDKEGKTPLMHAIDGKNPEIIQVFLQNPDVNYALIDKSGNSPLHYAIKNKNISVAAFLIKQKDINLNQVENNFKMAPLHLAMSYGMLDTAKQLITQHADVNTLDFRQENPLSYALSYGASMIKFLLENKADPNQPIKGSTIFQSIASTEDVDEAIIKLLLEYKGDITAADDENRNIFHYGAAVGNVETIKKLSKHLSSPASLNSLINAKQTKDELTPLHMAVEENESEYVKTLILLQADITVRNASDLTPFQLAISNENYAVAELFITLGKMDINTIDELNSDPISYFAKEDKWENIVNILLSTDTIYTQELDQTKLFTALMAHLNQIDNPTQQLNILNQVINQENSLGKLLMPIDSTPSLIKISLFYKNPKTMLLEKRSEIETLLKGSEHKLNAPGTS